MPGLAPGAVAVRGAVDPKLITVTAAIIEKDGRVLAARRKAGKHMAGYWELPGGKLEAGESPQQCLQRELAEELGIRTRVGEFVAESVYDYGDRQVRLLAYRVTHLGGAFLARDHDRLQWLLPGELHRLQWAPADLPLINAICGAGR
jgi:mutator protein MutT